MTSHAEQTYQQALVELEHAERELFHCEQALHDAHQSGIDEWVRAVSDHLHLAVNRQLRAAAALAELTAHSA
jgi:hypothetical protein